MTTKPLREELRSAVNMRQAALRNGRSRRKDIDRLRAAVGRAEVFLSSYPCADDLTVRRWCAWKSMDVELIVPGNKPALLARLKHGA
jgi:hypothetical protein